MRGRVCCFLPRDEYPAGCSSRPSLIHKGNCANGPLLGVHGRLRELKRRSCYSVGAMLRGIHVIQATIASYQDLMATSWDFGRNCCNLAAMGTESVRLGAAAKRLKRPPTLGILVVSGLAMGHTGYCCCCCYCCYWSIHSRAVSDHQSKRMLRLAIRKWVGATAAPRQGPCKATGVGMMTGSRCCAVGTAVKKHRSTGAGACEVFPEDPSGMLR